MSPIQSNPFQLAFKIFHRSRPPSHQLSRTDAESLCGKSVGVFSEKKMAYQDELEYKITFLSNKSTFLIKRVLFKPMTMMLHCRSHEYKNVKFLTAVSKLYLHIFQHLFVFKLSDRCEGGPNSVHCNIVTEATLSEPNSGTFSQLKIPVFKVPSPSTFEYISKLLRGRFELVEKFIAKLVHNFCSRFI